MEIVLGIVVLIFSAILHEVMHGFVADKLGDHTARLAGRLTLNPLPHIDPLTSILVPLVLLFSGSPIIFGAAKPVPINPLLLREGKKDVALVSLAGPLTNIVLAIVASFLFKIFSSTPFLDELFYIVVFYNLVLGIINLIPIPPLDGSKVISIIMPKELDRFYLSIEPFGIFLLFFLLVFPIGGFSLSLFIQNLLITALQLLGVPQIF